MCMKVKVALTDLDVSALDFVTDTAALHQTITRDELDVSIRKEAARIPATISRALRMRV